MSKQKHQQLSEEQIRSVKSKDFLGIILGSLLLFVLANIAMILYLRKFPPNKGYAIIQEKWQMLSNLEAPVDSLILGDSTSNQGIVPEILEAEWGGMSMNLATIGNALAIDDAWMLEKYLENHQPPRSVVLVFAHDVWARDINWEVTAQIPLRWGYWSQFEPRLNPSSKQIMSLFASRYLPLYSKSYSVQYIVEHPRQTFSNLLNYESPVQADGYMPVLKAEPGNVEYDKQLHLEEIRQKNLTFQLSTYNRSALDHILKLAEQYNFDVYLANHPIYEELYANAEFRAYFKQLQQTFKGYDAKSDRLHYILREPMTFSKDEMENADHVTHPAAIVYTKRIAEAVNTLQSNSGSSN
jgi:hypothetical protein